MAQIHKWRVVIIMAHDGETYFEYNDLEQSILDQSKFENLSYIIFYYNQKYKKISIKRAVKEPNRKYLQELPETADFADSDFYDPGTLTRFLKFVKSMEEDAQDDQQETIYHYFVVTWGHGGGLFYLPLGTIDDLLNSLGFNDKDHNELMGEVKKNFNENLLAYTQLCSSISFKGPFFPFLPTGLFQQTAHFADGKPTSGFLSKLMDFNSSVTATARYYTATDLNEILVAGLGKVDVLFTLSCFTQMLETGYELRHSVKMMVAPQTTMPVAGINYGEVFTTLENTPEISLPHLAKIMTRSYERKYASPSKFMADFNNRYPVFQLPIVSFACNFLDEYESLLESLNELTDFIRDIYTRPGLTPFKANISRARNACGDLTPDNNYGIIDLSNFINQLQLQFPNEFNKEIKYLKKKLKGVRKNVRAAIKKPDTTEAAPGMPRNNPLFLSFFAPAIEGGDIINFLLKMYTSNNNEYSRNSKWVTFVQEFYNSTSKP